jgi:hypothetical protein
MFFMLFVSFFMLCFLLCSTTTFVLFALQYYYVGLPEMGIAVHHSYTTKTMATATLPTQWQPLHYRDNCYTTETMVCSSALRRLQSEAPRLARSSFHLRFRVGGWGAGAGA